MSCKPTYKGVRYNSLEELYKEVNQLTPQQKQEAISKFQEYINTTGKQDIEGFKKFVDRGNIKEGVSELFDSNPELANQVYEALGFNNQKNKLVKSIIDAYSTGKPVNLPIDLLDRIKEFDRSTINDTINNIGRTRIDNLKENIKKEGLKNPLELTLNSKGNILLTEGNHRLIALLELGYKEVPVIIKERSELLKNILKEKAEQEYYYRDNEKLGLNLNIDFNNQITPQQKQQATFMFSEFLDAYLQDFEQVEKILKEEKIIDKKCS